jgi:hypothetical protein
MNSADATIIANLRRNSRISLSNLVQIIGLSRVTVRTCHLPGHSPRAFDHARFRDRSVDRQQRRRLPGRLKPVASSHSALAWQP